MRGGVLGYVFGRAHGDDFAAAGAAFRAQVDYPIRRLDDIQIVFDDYHRVALIAQPMQHVQQLLDVVEVQAGGGLVQDVERLAGAALGKFAGELHALRLAAGEGGGALAQAHVGEPHVHQRVQLALQHRHRVEEGAGLLDGHVQHFMDVLALVAHFQRLAVVALALANVAGHVDVWQKVHFHLDDAIALAGFAAPALDVEAEAAGLVAPRSRFLGLREQFANRREQAGVGGGVGARRAANRALVDVYHLVEVFQALHVFKAARRDGRGAVQRPRRDGIEGVVHQRRLAGAGNAGNASEQAGRQIDGDVLQVVAACLHQTQHALAVEGRAFFGDGDGFGAGEELPGDGLIATHHFVERAGDDDFAAVNASAGADVDDVVGGANGFLVVFHHQHGVAEIAQVRQRSEQPGVVALVQADGRLVQDVHHAHQPGADLAGQTDALRLATGERVGTAVQGQIVQAHIHQKAQPSAYLVDDLVGDLAAPAAKPQRLEMRQDGFHRAVGEAGQRDVVDEDMARFLLEPGSFASGAGAHGEVLLQRFAHGVGFRLSIAAFDVRNDAFEAMAAGDAVAAFVDVAEVDALAAGAEQHGVLLLLGEALEGLLDVEAVVLGQRAEHVEVVDVASVPAANRAFRQVQAWLRHH